VAGNGTAQTHTSGVAASVKPLGAPLLCLASVNGRLTSTYLVNVLAYEATTADVVVGDVYAEVVMFDAFIREAA
jgi:hypothetical protein